jgi:hypothetical protein
VREGGEREDKRRGIVAVNAGVYNIISIIRAEGSDVLGKLSEYRSRDTNT